MATRSEKNGLIELFRFLCSIWVVYFHGFLPMHSDKFNGVNISVDFFFMVSGLFFLRSMEKYRERPLSEGIRDIFWNRTKRFIVPLIIAALSILYCNIRFPWEFDGFNWPLSFLWFFAAQFVYLTLYFLLRRKLKGLKAFNIACVVLICIFMSVFRLDIAQFDRVFRGIAMVGIGILVSQIPKLRLGSGENQRLTLAVNAIGFAIAVIAFAWLAYLPGYAVWKLHLFTGVVCPALLYFATALPVRSKILNFLGEFSVFAYLAQCPILLHHYYVSRDTADQFPWLCICAVALFLLNRAINSRKVRGMLAKQKNAV